MNAYEAAVVGAIIFLAAIIVVALFGYFALTALTRIDAAVKDAFDKQDAKE